ncbi:MAG: patatin-like phospholipase family protein [Proteobacteria bacterium]|nr:patatin-like phospholipase family protein [Pseudomonadota bacterium]
MKLNILGNNMNNHYSKKMLNIGLALGSGSARGLAHIGVIRALEDSGIKIDCVAGTSIGALIGSVYASGKLEDLEKVYLDYDWKKIAYLFDIVFPKSGLIDGNKVADFVREYVHAQTIEHLAMPFKAVATDIGTGEEITMDQGDVIEAVRASISIPGIFTPVRRNGRVLVDGGLVNPVPVSTARSMGAKLIIAVDLNHDIIAGKAPESISKSSEQSRFVQTLSHMGGAKYLAAVERINLGLQSMDNPALNQIQAWLAEESLPNIFEVLLSSINVMATQITRTRLHMDPPDLLIQPHLGHIRFLEFNRAEEIINIGYEETCKQLEHESDKFLR